MSFSPCSKTHSSRPVAFWNVAADILVTVFGNVTWFFEEGLFLELLYNSDEYKRIVEGYVKNLGIEENIFNELYKFQVNAVKKPFESGKHFECDYDFIEYFSNVSAEKIVLKKETTAYTFEAVKTYDNWPTFAKEIVWYGRRKGATLYTNNISTVKTAHTLKGS